MALTKVKSILPGSPAQQAGVHLGETLTAINGHRIVDVLDYKFYSYDPSLTLTLRNETGTRDVFLEKEIGEDLGLEFETYLMDRARSCANNCIFCFVDQLPKGMRDTLYFKDDDARLSFLMGNYMTLTNLSRREIQRICDLHVSPINISVHATDPEVRKILLGHSKRGGQCLEIMKQFAAAGIAMNCQVVACPGLNDGPVLERTLQDLGELYDQVISVAVVPVGVTKYREGLYPLRPYTQDEAGEVIRQVEAFAAGFKTKHGTSFAWCSDEFYLLAHQELPKKCYYEDMVQLENGVGMIRLLYEQAQRAVEEIQPDDAPPSFAIATGYSAAPLLQDIVDLAQAKCKNIKGKVYPIRNVFFGETITVSGLVTGGDLMTQLKGKDLGERLLIPSNMLRAGESVFLDDVTLAVVEETLGVPVIPVDAESGFDLVDTMTGQKEESEAEVVYLLPEDEYYRYNP